MKLFTTWVVSAGLVLAATAADAQVSAPRGAGSAGYTAVSDVDGPYAAVPEGAPVPGYGPTLLPAPEVYTVLRENGFSPLGAPQLRGVVYTIAVIDRRGDDGRLVINARNGRIIRFMPGYGRGGNLNDDLSMTDGPVGSLPPISQVRGAPRPPMSIPRVASRTPSVPMPKASPRATEPAPLAAQPAPEPVQRSAATQPKPADAQAAVPAAPAAVAPAAVEAKPAPQIQPTQPMPKAQGLD
jgi:hypothetical protein